MYKNAKILHFIPYERSRDETGLFVDVETILWVTAIVWVLVCDSIVFVCGIDAAAILYDLPQLFYYSFIGIL